MSSRGLPAKRSLSTEAHITQEPHEVSDREDRVGHIEQVAERGAAEGGDRDAASIGEGTIVEHPHDDEPRGQW